MTDRLCVYALVSGSAGTLRATGIAGERLRQVRVAGVEVVVGVMPRPPRLHAAALRRYDRVMRELMETHSSVLPARFGTCADSPDELARAVRDRREAIRRSLRLVRNRAQMTLRLFTPAEDPIEARPAFRLESEREYGPTQGTEYLRTRARELQIPAAAPLRAAVRKWVRAERVERHEGSRLAGSIYHLIPRGAAPAYRRAMERAALRAGLTTVVSGPWPPYAFTE